MKLLALLIAFAFSSTAFAKDFDGSDGVYTYGTFGNNALLIFVGNVTVFADEWGVEIRVSPDGTMPRCRARLRRELAECDRNHQRCVCECAGPDCM